jgi:hypothetical protein
VDPAKLNTTLLSFADRNIFVRYIGGGVGHTHHNARDHTAVPVEDIDVEA